MPEEKSQLSLLAITKHPGVVSLEKPGILVIDCGSFWAICQPMSAEEAQRFQKMAQNISWVTQRAILYEQQIQSLLPFSVLPFRLGTIYRSEENLKASLLSEGNTFSEQLALVDGCLEWSVKVYFDHQESATKSHASPAISALEKEIFEASAGRRFFLQKKLEKLQKEEKDFYLENALQELHKIITDFSEALVLKKALSKEITEKKEKMILNAALLLNENQQTSFIHQLKNWENSNSNSGIQLHLGGPFAAYHAKDFYDEQRDLCKKAT